uniref:uncharacterized tRNA/rRNA methyltransferase slr0955 n=1 Tax=Erigeron canadensis TaxID=72917 RepID=UPI001CB8DB68|nr:uncharacterized tRNA/rRNA methyltransferase slr0955 [Erigeron canadensis]
MYCNFTKLHTFPIAIRASSQQPKCFLQLYINPKTPKCLPSLIQEKPICCYGVRRFKSTYDYCSLLVSAKKGTFSNGVCLKSRNFSTFVGRKAVEGSGSTKTFPWLAKNKDKEVKEFERSGETRRASWEESAGRFTKDGREKIRRKDFKEKSGNSENGLDSRKAGRSSWEVSAEKFVERGVGNEDRGRKLDEGNGFRERRNVSGDEPATRKAVRSSWEESAQKVVKSGGESREKGRRFDKRNDYRERRGVSEDELDVDNEEVDNPSWYKVKERLGGFDKVANVERNGNEFRKWNRQDEFGKKVWREATESSVPKMVGECVYGVGPVLAALSANRREFYVLYVQEGKVEFSGNNKRKKDKKGFEKVLRVANKLGLTIKEISKHDLNMVVDSRPHQGLVLDASPLEMVNIRELDRVVTDGEEGAPLWLALDEVMDPQNLGAIMRSAYFFGAAGVVLCAKNSAPLSGVVSKASAGSLEMTELRSCKNMMQFLISSAENGWRVVGGSVSSRAVTLNEVTPGEPTILVLGSEGTGLRPLVERSCTQLVKIPGNSPVHVGAGLDDADTEEFQSFLAVESLNVSVAAGVLLHHLVGAKNTKTALDVEL